jgi:hypothetical protein
MARDYGKTGWRKKEIPHPYKKRVSSIAGAILG